MSLKKAPMFAGNYYHYHQVDKRLGKWWRTHNWHWRFSGKQVKDQKLRWLKQQLVLFYWSWLVDSIMVPDMNQGWRHTVATKESIQSFVWGTFASEWPDHKVSGSFASKGPDYEVSILVNCSNTLTFCTLIKICKNAIISACFTLSPWG